MAKQAEETTIQRLPREWHEAMEVKEAGRPRVEEARAIHKAAMEFEGGNGSCRHRLCRSRRMGTSSREGRRPVRIMLATEPSAGARFYCCSLILCAGR